MQTDRAGSRSPCIARSSSASLAVPVGAVAGVLERLASIPPRDMRKLLLDAFGTARLAGRDHLRARGHRRPQALRPSRARRLLTRRARRAAKRVARTLTLPNALRRRCYVSSILRGQYLCSSRDSARSASSAAGLAARAVVALVLGVHDALHRRAAHGTRLIERAVHGHLRPERGDLLREAAVRLARSRSIQSRSVARVASCRRTSSSSASSASARAATAARGAGSRPSTRCRCR